MVLAAQENSNRENVSEEGDVSYALPQSLPLDCFRTYDIRGEVSAQGLNPNVAYAIGLAFGSQARAAGDTEVLVARDGRLSGPAMKAGLIAGLLETGIDVIDIGVVATPVLYFATHRLATRSGIMVTASHNPSHHNGFKIVFQGRTLSGDDIQNLRARI